MHTFYLQFGSALNSVRPLCLNALRGVAAEILEMPSSCFPSSAKPKSTKGAKAAATVTAPVIRSEQDKIKYLLEDVDGMTNYRSRYPRILFKDNDFNKPKGLYFNSVLFEVSVSQHFELFNF